MTCVLPCLRGRMVTCALKLAEAAWVKKGVCVGYGVRLRRRCVVKEATSMKNRFRSWASPFGIGGRRDEIGGVEHALYQLEGDLDILRRASGMPEMEMTAVTIEVADGGMTFATKALAKDVGGKDASGHSRGVVTFSEDAGAIRGKDAQVANANRAVNEIVSDTELYVVVNVRTVIPKIVLPVGGGGHGAAITMSAGAEFGCVDVESLVMRSVCGAERPDYKVHGIECAMMGIVRIDAALEKRGFIQGKIQEVVFQKIVRKVVKGGCRRRVVVKKSGWIE